MITRHIIILDLPGIKCAALHVLTSGFRCVQNAGLGNSACPARENYVHSHIFKTSRSGSAESPLSMRFVSANISVILISIFLALEVEFRDIQNFKRHATTPFGDPRVVIRTNPPHELLFQFPGCIFAELLPALFPVKALHLCRSYDLGNFVLFRQAGEVLEGLTA